MPKRKTNPTLVQAGRCSQDETQAQPCKANVEPVRIYHSAPFRRLRKDAQDFLADPEDHCARGETGEISWGMNRNFKQQFEAELGVELMEKEEAALWDALNPSSTKEQVERASEKLYDLLLSRGVKVRDD